MAAERILIHTRHTCEHCMFRQMFERTGLTGEEIDFLGNANVLCRGPYRRGEHICHAGDRINSLFVITSGAVKTEITATGGRQVTGFFLTGESFGAEAIGHGAQPFDAIALQKTIVCELSYVKLENLCAADQWLQHEVLLFLASRIRTCRRAWVLRRNLKAEQRIICFLKDLRRRIALRQRHDPGEMRLPMTKEDIARYLNLTPATLSRVLAKLDSAGVIRNKTKRIELLAPGVADSSYAICD